MNLTLDIDMFPIRMRLEEPMSEESLMRFCRDNEMLRIEREPNGELVLMPIGGLEFGGWTADIAADLVLWARHAGQGRVMGPNAGFSLPDGSIRAACIAWISHDRWTHLTSEQRRGYAATCPEFVIELRSECDRLTRLRNKMKAWIANGVELAWLIDPQSKVVEAYRRNEAPEIHEHPISVQGSGLMRGFNLSLSRIWNQELEHAG